MSSKNLPPVRHLPQWSRVGRLGVPCSPRRLQANRLQPLPVLPAGDRGGQRAKTGSVPVDADARVASLQRNIEFLQYQHQETLHKLHQEVDILRRENKGDQLSNLSKSFYSFIIKLGKHIKSMGDCVDIHGPYRANRRSGQLATSLQPLHIHNGLSHPPRASTLRECELIIRQLYNTNSLQSQEVRGHSPKCLPPICVSQLTRRHLCLLDCATGVTLPALTQSLSSSVAERPRRSRAVHRGHVKTTVR
uniref:Si:ch211-222n4.2 n=1 Tax=Hippocampus comes TaxID=109280 RepID=A0A3Q3DAT6_HIPCM